MIRFLQIATTEGTQVLAHRVQQAFMDRAASPPFARTAKPLARLAKSR